jgi:uncharacterized protein YndB with AHSA1/START domain
MSSVQLSCCTDGPSRTLRLQSRPLTPRSGKSFRSAEIAAQPGPRTPLLASLAVVAVRASREVVIDAPPELILEALADVGSVPSWSPVHKRAEVIDSYPDGRPHHVKVTVRVVGIVDTEVLEYHWGPDWLVWDADKTLQQHAQHVEYTLQRETDDKTRVRFEITLEPSAPLPEFLVNRARKKVLYAATEGLRRRVMAAVGSDRPR